MRPKWVQFGRYVQECAVWGCAKFDGAYSIVVEYGHTGSLEGETCGWISYPL